MTGVYILANRSDKKMQITLPAILNRSFRTGDCAGPNTQLLINPSAPNLVPDNAILIFKEPATVSDIPYKGSAVVVVDSAGSGELLAQAGATKLPAITCGLASRDTLTLSSLRTDSVLLAVQRPIPCFDGSLLEPQEIPIRLVSALDSFTIMAAAAVFLLTGHKDLLHHARFGLDSYNNYHSYNSMQSPY